MEVKPVMAFYRGHTHGEFAFPPTAPVARVIGNWARDKLSVKEFRPAGMYWNKVIGRREFLPKAWLIKKQFCFYDNKTDRFHVPIGFCDELKGIVESFGGEIKEIPLPSYPLRKMQIKMREFFMEKGKKIMIEERPVQVDPIKKCSDPTPGIKGIALRMGLGKTFCATKVSLNLGHATLIICPGSLVDQWVRSFMRFTTAAPKDGSIYKLAGFESFNLLAKNPRLKPDVFVASQTTIRSFSLGEDNYKFLPWTFAKFFEAYGIGTKIIDECHKCFHANEQMDLRLNVPHNIYLTATFTQNGEHIKKIFDRVYPESIRYGREVVTKYTITYFYNFSGLVDPNRVTTNKGYNQVKYEQQLMRSNRVFGSNLRNVVIPAIDRHFIPRFKPGLKLLIFCAFTEYINMMVDELKKVYPDKRIISYTSADDLSVLDRCDVAVTTTGKSATGLDVRGLITVINTYSMKSPPLSEQLFGRLRRIDGEDVVYVDFCDVNVPAHVRHAEERKPALRAMSKEFHELNLFGDSGLSAPIGQAPYGMTF